VYSLLSMSTFLSQQNTQNTVTLGVGTVSDRSDDF